MAGRDDEADGWSIALPLERLARLMRAGEHGEGLNPAQREALRYLARANRFSNSPGAVTRYLGATKGTISQTLKALERKGLLVKSARPGERRSVILTLTPAADQALATDPWTKLAAAAAGLGGKTRRRFARGLEELLSDELATGGFTRFGTCASCRYFREKGRDQGTDGPHLCMFFDEGLSETESGRLCASFEASS
jgi:DNA-binding MarR family transcriptional regulator